MTTKIEKADWLAAGRERYGDETHLWRFKCPSCGHVASVKDWQDAGAPEGAVAFSCVGRYRKGDIGHVWGDKQPCDYAGGGLFKLNPIHVDDGQPEPHTVFDFADDPLQVQS
ncbi:hypothetical protein EJ076_34960 [Mesorhizobium sp. M7D.F.Ca.US.005.01.1.1]|uniref:VVA0879 family protein n=1 Tax=Mesorhizobium sp. M7D.F.Ca.US.005.01.1.1 TaxID=2493678 RepID=UPI000F75499E|nr:VVA0879 family protein [Mesorhizobium sp. M7D.F.Ca.US.005.01.1.1]AZO45917.1 hypothetical protein EJ076_34960 [Mesorhizobium sp. M7D.F.Ca.US.005.01.1.1]